MIKQRKSQKEYIKDFVKLIEENPDLPVLPMVDGDIILGDDYQWWVASIGESYVDQYHIEDGRFYMYSKDFDDVVENYIESLENDDNYNVLPEDISWDDAVREVANYEWVKAIMLKIDTPDGYFWG